MIRVAAYCRVSTDSEDQLHSFQSQREFFEEYIEKQDSWQLHAVYADEGISGTQTHNRSQFNRMIEDARQGSFSLILTKEVSRFSRNLLDTIAYTRELRYLGIEVRFLTDGICTMEPDAELRLSIMASLAQEESRRISGRVTWGQARQMEKGVVFGRSLLGYEVRNGALRIDPIGAETVRLIFEKYALEEMGTKELADYLNDNQYQTGGGSRWTPSGIIKLLHNEKYVGDLVQGKTFTPDYLTHKKKKNSGERPIIALQDHHEPIISRELWELARSRMEINNRRREGERGHSSQFLFSGKIICGQCGRVFRSRMKRSGSNDVRYWCCPSAPACGIGKLLRDEDAVRMLQTAVKHLPLDKETFVVEIYEELNGIPKRETKSKEIRKRIQQKIQAVLDAYFTGEITKEEMLYMKRQYEQEQEKEKNRVQSGQIHQGDLSVRQGILRDKMERFLVGDHVSQALYRCILGKMTIKKNGYIEVFLKDLNMKFLYNM